MGKNGIHQNKHDYSIDNEEKTPNSQVHSCVLPVHLSGGMHLILITEKATTRSHYINPCSQNGQENA